MRWNWRTATAAVLLCCVGSVLPAPTQGRAESAIAHSPIIDMHLHAPPPGRGRTPQEMLKAMDANGVVVALLMANDGQDAARWHAAAPDRFLPSVVLPCDKGRDPNLAPCFADSGGWPAPAWLRQELAAGKLKAVGELYYVYYGIDPADPRLEPYWAAAEAAGVPVIIHTGRRPPATLPKGCCRGYDNALGNPALLEPVLRRHPHLRISLAHIGQPSFIDQAIALMKAHPNVYGDLSVVNAQAPMAGYEVGVRRFRDAGLLDRLMFGSDNNDFAKIIARTDALTFLSEAERRAIYCGNAARFLRLDPRVCAPRSNSRGRR